MALWRVEIVSVNVGERRSFQIGGSQVESGVVKLPAQGAIEIASEGLAGDFIANPSFHGGPDQAVYLYGSVDYDWWREAHAYDPAAGFFGENLTVADLASQDICVGDRFCVGDQVVLEATGPRMPCAVMGNRSGDTEFMKRFLVARRPGVSCRVIEAGPVEARMPVRFDATEGPKVSMAALGDAYYRKDLGREEIEALLRAPLGVRLVERFTKMLRK